MKELIECIHGKKDGIDKLIQSFQHPNHLHISKVQIKKRMLEIAEKSKHVDGHGTARWVVKKEFLEKHTPEVSFMSSFALEGKSDFATYLFVYYSS
jgi:hypothetical protein